MWDFRENRSILEYCPLSWHWGDNGHRVGTYLPQCSWFANNKKQRTGLFNRKWVKWKARSEGSQNWGEALENGQGPSPQPTTAPGGWAAHSSVCGPDTSHRTTGFWNHKESPSPPRLPVSQSFRVQSPGEAGRWASPGHVWVSCWHPGY